MGLWLWGLDRDSTRGQCSMYGISILSLVSTASLRNWSVFLFLEEGKENSVSLDQGQGGHHTVCSALEEDGPPAPLHQQAQVECQGAGGSVPSEQQSCSTLFFASAWIGFLGTAGEAQSSAATLHNNALALTLPGPAAPVSVPLPAHG